jgi:hypothetical protein
MDTLTFQIHTVDPDVVERVRRTGRDVNDNPVERVVATGGEPLRCCLTDARPGDDLLLAGYRPALPAASPYVETGAVFVHAAACAGPADATSYPEEWRRRPQVLRAYDQRGWIHPATTVHDGTDAPAALAAVLAEPGVVEVHSRNIGYGCFMFAATRPA